MNENTETECAAAVAQPAEVASNLATVPELSNEIRNVIAAAQHSINVALERRARLIAEWEVIERTPLTSDDARALMLDHIDAMAERYVTEGGWASTIARLSYPNRPVGSRLGHPERDSRDQPLCLGDQVAARSGDSSVRIAQFGDEFLALSVGYMAQDGSPVSVSGLCFWFGDVLKQKLTQHWDRIWPQYRPHDQARVGPTADQLLARAREVMQTIETLDAEIATMQGHIASAQQAVRANLSDT